MKAPMEYNWLESYFDNDILWLDDVLNWDNVYDAMVFDWTMLSFFFSTTFLSTNFFIDAWNKVSFLDLLIAAESDTATICQVFFDFFIFDVVTSLQTNFFILQYLFCTDYQDFLTTLLFHSPELVLGLVDFFRVYWFTNVLAVAPGALFDIFIDSLNLSLSEFTEYFVAFFLFTWSLVFFLNTFRLAKWAVALETYLVRVYYYFFLLSRDTRLQFEAVLKILFFFVLYFSMMVATFDDDQEELLETFHLLSFYAFLTSFAYLVYRYSLHYFSFLQATQSKGRLFVMLTQFASDMANTFALALRFIVLMIRLNMYDFLDDILDSYYIFVCDFDDEEYLTELFFSTFSVLFFDTDNQDDRSFFLEDEIDFFLDFFSLYWVVWAKFSLFFWFAGDEIFRVTLAFYLVYLIIFEMQTVNRSFVEDSYLLNKRSVRPRHDSIASL